MWGAATASGTPGMSSSTLSTGSSWSMTSPTGKAATTLGDGWLRYLKFRNYTKYRSAFKVTRAESGSGKPVGESWDGNNISVTDIGEVQISIMRLNYDPDSNLFLFQVQIPLLVVGTKADVMSERSIPTHMRRLHIEEIDDPGLTFYSFRSDIAEELGTEEIHLNCNDPSSLAAGSSAATKLSRFFDKVRNS